MTGAHFTTALAVIEELKKYKNLQIIYVGRKTTREGDPSQSVESQVLPKLGVKFIPIIAGRLQRTFTIYTIPALLKIPIGLVQAWWIILQEKPDVVLSFGGYVAVPIVVVSWFFSIPIIIHDQTLVSGLANKISSFFADKVAIAFSENKSFGKEKVVLTGNPIRGEIKQAASMMREKGGLPRILITGGNQGSHVINLAVEESLEKLTKIATIIHLTGDSKFKDFERLKARSCDKYEVKKFIEEMGQVMVQSDLVVSRAGINTLTELAFLEKPALLIPVPYLYQDEQQKNALFFKAIGMVKVLPQSKLSPETLYKNIQDMIKNLDQYKSAAKAAKKLIIPDAAKRLALETIILKDHTF